MAHFERLGLGGAVEEVDESVVGAAQDLVAILAEADGEEAEAAVLRGQGQCLMVLFLTENVHLVY